MEPCVRTVDLDCMPRDALQLLLTCFASEPLTERSMLHFLHKQKVVPGLLPQVMADWQDQYDLYDRDEPLLDWLFEAVREVVCVAAGQGYAMTVLRS